jgi:pimeloyl-ACP methyl ester carboxylesterase
MAAVEYDEFGLFQENAEEFDIPWRGPPAVRREFVDAGGGRRVSALVWGDGDPELVLVHGGAQNAHTWDTVALALDRPLVAVDLPGHGHSDWREDRRYWPVDNAKDVATAIRALAPSPRLVVGMSLGGLTSVALAARHPELVPRLVLVDVTPGVDKERAAPIAQFVSGPESFESFDEILQRTIEYNPTRSVESLRRGVLHNAMPREDGRWVWRYQRPRAMEMALAAEDREGGAPAQPDDTDSEELAIFDFTLLWDDVSNIQVPVMLLRGTTLGSVVTDEHAEEFARRQPTARIVSVEGAGHSLQGDKPVETAALLEDFLDS